MSAARLGLDLGSVSAHAALLSPDGELLWAATRPTAGKPVAALVELLDDCPVRQGVVQVAATGSGAHLVRERVAEALVVNDVVSTARGVARVAPEARGIIEIGGHMSRWISLDEQGELADFALSELCAAGAGVFLDQQAGRLRMGVAELAEVARSAPRGATVAGRCTVFAKSDMIHLQQKGTPVEEIAYGLCLALARNFQSSILRGRDLVLPVAVVGGGVANAGLLRALSEILDIPAHQLVQVRDAVEVGAIGAALGAEESERTTLEAVLHGLGQERGAPRALHRFEALPDPGVPVPPPEPDGSQVQGQPVLLGVDVGSVSTNLVLVTEAGELVDALYLATRGRPLEVLQEGLGLLREHHPHGVEIIGVATTGSGRHLAGRFLGADLVRNEITAQLRGAAEVMPRIDTVFEIGGQDSKYISARDGHIHDFTMNKVCAAGTGSFLEEQAERLGISIIGEFADLALTAEAPVDLGSRCTVFMDSELAHAMRAGVGLPDLTAGLALSVARNYLEKVVAGRSVGEHVLFQGGTASNRAVVAAFRQLLGRPVHVHPHNRVSGALGAAMLLMDARAAGEIAAHTSFRGLDSCHGQVERSFECRKCSNRCQVTRFRAGDDVFFFGDTCELYSSQGGKGPAATVDHPLARRQALLFEAADLDLDRDVCPEEVDDPDQVLGIPLASVNLQLLPVWAEVARAAGRRPVLSSPSSPAVLSLGQRLLKVDTCLPVKLTYGHVEDLRRRGVRDILLPATRSLPRRRPDDPVAETCPYTHHLPWMLDGELLAPEVDLGASPSRWLRNAPEVAERLGMGVAELRTAVVRGLRKLEGWSAQVRLLAEETLESTDGPVLVVMGRSYNLGDAFLNMDLGRHLSRLGLPVVPLDALPLETVALDESYDQLRWGSSRDYVRAARLIQRDARLFPVVLSSFGCGPDGFSVKHLEPLLGDRPRLMLEIDEHRAEAGFVTRLEAFRDEIEAHQRPTHRDRRVLPSVPVRLKRTGRVVAPYVGDQIYSFVGAMRRAGVEVTVLEPPDELSRHEGESIASGRECHPWVLIAGDLIKAVKQGQIRDGDRFFFPGGLNSCLFSQYVDGMRHALRRVGMAGVELYTPTGPEMILDWGLLSVVSLYQGSLAIDYLTRALYETRPYERHPGETDRVHQDSLERMALAIERMDAPRVLSESLARYAAIERVPGPRRPRIGVAGDIYTRINDFGNGGLLARIEELGCEVWPAPYLSDTADFGTSVLLQEAMSHTEVKGILHHGSLAALRDLSSWRLNRALPEWASDYPEPRPAQILDWSTRYVGMGSNQILHLNIAKMVHFAAGGAAGVVNAICFGCMLGGVSAALVDKVRHDHDGIPMTTVAFGGTEGSDGSARLEAFVHQVKRYHERHVLGSSKDPRSSESSVFTAK